MANFFDQFDPKPAGGPAAPRTEATAKGANFFDQFDAPAQPAEPAAPAPKPAGEVDPIRAQVRKEIEADRAKGNDTSAGLARRVLQGATFNLADEALAGLMTVPEMIRRKTLSPTEAYAYAKAREDMDLDDGRKRDGLVGSFAELAGGAASGLGLMSRGVTAVPAAARALGSGLAGTAAGLAVDGAAIGGLSAAADGNGADRLAEGVKGAALGGAVGAALPIGASVLGTVAAPIVSNVRARLHPAAYADRQIGRVAAESGLPPETVGQRLADAAADGQTEFRLMDALGLPGQRKAANVGKSPGEGRTMIRDFVEQRQAGQGRRVSSALAEGLDAPESAAQASSRMTRARSAADDEAFGQVRTDASPVDITRTVDRIDETLRPGLSRLASPESGIAYDSVEGALSRARSLLTDGRSNVTDFAVVQRARDDIADAAQKAYRAGEGNKHRLLSGVRRELDAALEAASPGYRDAMAQSRNAAREIDAIDTGRAAATRGRSEDTIPAFRGMTPGQQQAYRAGYADPLIERVQGAAVGRNKAAEFTSDAFRDEAAAVAPMRTGPQMARRLDRENQMFSTRNHVSGGSSTAENLADEAAAGIDVGGILAKVLSGHWTGAARDALRAGGNGLNGNTAAVREELARRLLLGSPEAAQDLLARLARQQGRQSNAARYLGRGIESGGSALLESFPKEKR